MEYVNCLVAIGGDQGQTVAKNAIPVSEVPVLLAIHGDGSLFDFELVDAPADADDLTDREEIDRLYGIYGHAKDGEGFPLIRTVYPSLSAPAVRTLDQLGVPEEAFRVTARAVPQKAKPTRAKKAEAKAEAAEDTDPGVME